MVVEMEVFLVLLMQIFNCKVAQQGVIQSLKIFLYTIVWQICQRYVKQLTLGYIKFCVRSVKLNIY